MGDRKKEFRSTHVSSEEVLAVLKECGDIFVAISMDNHPRDVPHVLLAVKRTPESFKPIAEFSDMRLAGIVGMALNRIVCTGSYGPEQQKKVLNEAEGIIKRVGNACKN